MDGEKTVEQVAESLERARYEALMSKPWSGLRPEERETRLAMGRQVLVASGILEMLAASDARVVAAEQRADAADEARVALERQLATMAQEAQALRAAVEPLRAQAAAATALARDEALRADSAERVIKSLHRTERPPTL